MATYNGEGILFARSPASCPVNPFCLGLCSWTSCPGNADSEPHPLPELEREPLLELTTPVPCHPLQELSLVLVLKK